VGGDITCGRKTVNQAESTKEQHTMVACDSYEGENELAKESSRKYPPTKLKDRGGVVTRAV